jgi:molybdate transport system substrate-binding protein
VQPVAIPADVNATNTYPIAVLTSSRQAALAGEFRDLVRSAAGREVLADAGFGTP